jgi:hypothetical protein
MAVGANCGGGPGQWQAQERKPVVVTQHFAIVDVPVVANKEHLAYVVDGIGPKIDGGASLEKCKRSRAKANDEYYIPRRPDGFVATEADRWPTATWQGPDQAATSTTTMMMKEEALSPWNNCNERRSYRVP